MSSTRHRVLALYKELHRLGRDYPDHKYSHPFLRVISFRKLTSRRTAQHSYDFNGRIRRMFESSYHYPSDERW